MIYHSDIMAGIKLNWTMKDLDDMVSRGTLRGYTVISDEKKLESMLSPQPPKGKEKRSKYGSRKVEYNGIVFDSEKECKRYKDLLLMIKAGDIGLLRLQVPYELNEGGSHSLKYIADFVYVDAKTGITVVEDAKGFRTVEYRKKKRLMKKIHGIDIHEV